MNIVKIISTVSKLSGSKISTTLNKGALEMLAKKHAPKAAQPLKGFLNCGALKEPYVDIAMKSSKNGYTIGAFKIRDGKEVIANGAVSVSNLGTPKSVVKYRLNYGENGNAVRVNAFLDNSHKYKLADAEFNIGRKKGVITVDETIGKAAGGNIRVDERGVAQWYDRLLPEPLGTNGYKALREKINKFGQIGQNLYKKLLAGQDASKEIGKAKEYSKKITDFLEKVFA